MRYELSTGRVEWATREVAHYENALAGEGPRATPTIHGGRVYAMGATGLLTAIELDSGKTLWKRDVIRDGDTDVPIWGKSDSPLILDGRVIGSGGESATLVAYDAERGEEIWRGGRRRRWLRLAHRRNARRRRANRCFQRRELDGT